MITAQQGGLPVPMTDAELATFCGFKPEDDQAKVAAWVANLSPAKRQMMETMRQVEMWDATDGLVPLPAGVMIDRHNPRKKFHRSNTD